MRKNVNLNNLLWEVNAHEQELYKHLRGAEIALNGLFNAREKAIRLKNANNWDSQQYSLDDLQQNLSDIRESLNEINPFLSILNK